MSRRVTWGRFYDNRSVSKHIMLVVREEMPSTFLKGRISSRPGDFRRLIGEHGIIFSFSYQPGCAGKYICITSMIIMIVRQDQIRNRRGRIANLFQLSFKRLC